MWGGIHFVLLKTQGHRSSFSSFKPYLLWDEPLSLQGSCISVHHKLSNPVKIIHTGSFFSNLAVFLTYIWTLALVHEISKHLGMGYSISLISVCFANSKLVLISFGLGCILGIPNPLGQLCLSLDDRKLVRMVKNY